jgi:SAM-dependent methyltransferase
VTLWLTKRMIKRTAKRLGAMRLYRPLKAFVVTHQDPERVWARSASDMVDFWRECLPERIATSPEYRRRMDPNGYVGDFFLAEHVERIDSDHVSIIDVGSGPLTAVGQHYPGKRLSVTATDALSGDYNRLMDEQGIAPPVRPVECSGEDLLEVFEPGSFDIAYGLNAVDHTFDPVRVISNMVAVVRPGGFVVLVHRRREAVRECYRHMHQWNFDIDDDDFVVWRTTKEMHNVTELLHSSATTTCVDHDGWVLCSIEKH